MIAFTFPGQGSQRPGMGRPWLDHPTWELVAEASEIAGSGRDVGRLLLDADADELKRHPQRPARHLRRQPGGARRRRAPRRRAQLLRRPQPRRVHRPGGHRRARASTTASGSSPSGATPCRTPATRTRARWPPSSASTTTRSRSPAAGPTATSGSPTTTPRARSSSPARPTASPRRGAAAKELGAKKVMPLPVGGAFHTPFMSPPATGSRKAIADADLRDAEIARRRQRRRPAPHRRQRVGQPAVGPALAARCAGASRLLRARRRSASPQFVELGPGGVLTGMAKRTVTGARTISVATPDDLDTLLECPPHRVAGTEPSRCRGRAPLRHRAGRGQPGRRRVHPRPPTSAPAPRSPPAPCSATSASTRSARRSPGVLQSCSPSTASGSPPASPSPGCARPDAPSAAHPPRPRALARGHRSPGGVITGWGTAPDDASPTPTSSRGLDTTDEWIVERTGIQRAPRRRHHRPASAIEAGRGRPSRLAGRSHRRSTIDLVVLATTTPDQHVPATAADRAARARPALRRLRPQRRLLGLRLRPRHRPRPHRHGLRPGARHRRRDPDPHHRLGRPQHRRPLRRRRRRGRARGGRGPGPAARLGPRLRRHRAASTCYADIGGYMQMDGKEVFRRAVRVMVDSAEKSMSRAGVDRRRHRPRRPPPGQRPHHRGRLRPPRHPAWTGPSSCSTTPATRRRPRSRSPSPTRSTPAGWPTATSSCSSGSAPA